MRRIFVFFSLLFISLSSLVAYSAESSVECYGYSGEEFTPNMGVGATMPFANVVRIEKAKVQGKDRLTVFLTVNNFNVSKHVYLGSGEISEKGFSFKGTDTVSYDTIEAGMLGNSLKIRRGNYQTTRYVQNLAMSQAGQQCRQGLHPEDLSGQF